MNTAQASSTRPAVQGFILLEALLAVAIFSIAVLALGRSVQHCIAAESFKEEDAHARRVLENRMVEIEGGAEPLVKDKTEDLKSPNLGMKLRTVSSPLQALNEQKQEIGGLYDVILTLEWVNNGQPQKRSQEFYVFPRQRN